MWRRGVVAKSRQSWVASSIYCSRRSIDKWISVVNAVVRIAQTKVVTSTVTERKGLTSTTTSGPLASSAPPSSTCSCWRTLKTLWVHVRRSTRSLTAHCHPSTLLHPPPPPPTMTPCPLSSTCTSTSPTTPRSPRP